MAPPKENDDVPMLPVSDKSHALVQMSDPLSSTRSPEPPFSLLPPPPPTSGYSDSIVVSSTQPERNHPYNRKTSDSTLHNALDDGAKGWASRVATSADILKHRIRIPYSKYHQKWTQSFVILWLFSIFVDPLFFFSIEVDNKYKCIQINWPLAIVLVVVRSFGDLLFLLLLMSRWAHEAHESTVVGARPLAPRKIVRRYWGGILNVIILMPIPQIMILYIIPQTLGAYRAHDMKNILRIGVVLQCIPKLYKLFPLLAGQKPTGFIFQSALVNLLLNLFSFVLAGHVVGSFWYLFGLQRVNECLGSACVSSDSGCKELIVCGREPSKEVLKEWKSNDTCFQENGFSYGVYLKAVSLTRDTNLFKRYSYSLFWGFQQISTLAGNQVPSYYFGDILFTMIIIALGLLLLALLIGNMQNFLLGIGRRNMEMILRRRDVNQWMSHRRIPEDIRKRMEHAEQFNWSVTKGVNDEMLFENMPDDIQRDIRRHLFAILKKVRIFSKMEEPILDAIRERLKNKTYVNGSTVLHRGDLVKKMVFIVKGTMESTGEDGSVTPLVEGDFYGEELLTWCGRSSLNPDGTRIRMPSKGLRSNRKVECVTDVEAVSLSAADLEDVLSLFPTLEIPKQS